MKGKRSLWLSLMPHSCSGQMGMASKDVLQLGLVMMKHFLENVNDDILGGEDCVVTGNG